MQTKAIGCKVLYFNLIIFVHNPNCQFMCKVFDNKIKYKLKIKLNNNDILTLPILLKDLFRIAPEDHQFLASLPFSMVTNALWMLVY